MPSPFDPWSSSLLTVTLILYEQSSQDGAWVRILIVDDHMGFRQAVRRMLESSGNLQVCGEASNGEEAIQQTLELRPDLVILDISMPVMDGLTAAKEIKKALPDIPVLMLSSFRELVQASKEAGVQGFVIKTEVDDVLLEAVDQLLRGQPFFRVSGSE
jgi:DNA-binding NarL/FixJ family response regulator